MGAAEIFDQAARERVESAIRAAEAKTVVEIVPVVADRSARYHRAEDALGLSCAFLGFVLVGLFSDDFAVHVAEGVAIMIVGVAAGTALLARLDPLVRSLAGKADMVSRSEEQALRHFRTFGVGETAGRTGVLLYVSLFEHVAVVLEDSPVAAALPPGSAEEVRDLVLARMREGRPVDALVEAVQRLGELLAPVFPRQPDDVNELPDSLRIISDRT
jgi:putative membrane protein